MPSLHRFGAPVSCWFAHILATEFLSHWSVAWFLGCMENTQCLESRSAVSGT
jgi:hypothetical protein